MRPIGITACTWLTSIVALIILSFDLAGSALPGWAGCGRPAKHVSTRTLLVASSPLLRLRGGGSDCQTSTPAGFTNHSLQENNTPENAEQPEESDIEFLDPNEALQFEDEEGREYEFEDDYEHQEQSRDADDEDRSMESEVEEGDEGTWKEEALREFRDDSLRCFAHSEPVYAVALSPFDSALIAAGGGDDKVRLWGLSGGGQEGKVLGEFNDSVTALAFSHDGTYLAAASLDGTARVWVADCGEEAAAVAASEGLLWAEWHPRGPVLLGGCEDGLAFLWEVAHQAGAGQGYQARCLQVLAGHQGMVTCGGFADLGKLVVTGCEDGAVRVFSPKTGKALHTLRDPVNLHAEPVTALACHSLEAICVSGDRAGRLAVVQVQQGRRLLRLPSDHSRGHSASVEAVAISRLIPSLLASASLDGSARLWDLSTGAERACCWHGGEGVSAARWSGKSPLLVTATVGGALHLWNGMDGSPLRVLRGHKAAVAELAVALDGRSVLAASLDKTARLFSLAPSSSVSAARHPQPPAAAAAEDGA